MTARQPGAGRARGRAVPPSSPLSAPAAASPDAASPYYFTGPPSLPATAAAGESRLDASTFELPGAAALRSLLSELTAGKARSEVEPARPDANRFYFIDGSNPEKGPAPALGASSAHPPFDVHAVRRDFPILQERVNGRQLVWFDNAATTQKPQAVIDRLSALLRTRELATSTAPRTSWRRAPPMPTRARARRCAASSAPLGGRDHLRARHHRGHQPGGQELGREEHRRGRRDHRHPPGAPRQHRALAAARPARRARSSASSRWTTRAR